MTTDQQQEARWEKRFYRDLGDTLPGAWFVIGGNPTDMIAKCVEEADADQIIRDHGQADVAEALRAENVRLREALTEALEATGVRRSTGGAMSTAMEKQIAFALSGQAPKWELVDCGSYWHVVRVGYPYGPEGISQSHDPFGNFTSREWASQVCEFANGLEAALAAKEQENAELRSRLVEEAQRGMKNGQARIAAELRAEALATALEEMIDNAFAHVTSTHYIRECIYCGRQSYEDGTGIETNDILVRKPIHTNRCTVASARAALDAYRAEAPETVDAR